MGDTVVIEHTFMGRPPERRLMQAAYFRNADRSFSDPHCAHAVTLADVCPECDEATRA